MYTSTHTAHAHRGAALPASLLLIAAATLLAVGALRTARSEAQLGGSLLAARAAFELAEIGLAAGVASATNNPSGLPASTPLSLPALQLPGMGSVATSIHPVANDNECPALAPAAAERWHFEIRAAGSADRGAVDRHTLGFYVCRELCASAACVAAETLPVASYWQAVAGVEP